jgi:soluble lytic murein transglycosylase-like protein
MNTSGLLNDQRRGGFARVLPPMAISLLVILTVMLIPTGLLSAPDDGEGHWAASGSIRYDGAAEAAAAAAAERHRALAAYLSKRYRIAHAATEQLVGVAYDAGQQVGLDPLLILAVMAIESRFNPFAESETGAQGLMQIIPIYHKDKIEAHGGQDGFLDPVTNVSIGARILKEYIGRMGSLEAGLQFYAGAVADTSSQYAQKVIAEQQRLRQALQRGERVSRSAAI